MRVRFLPFLFAAPLFVTLAHAEVKAKAAQPASMLPASTQMVPGAPVAEAGAFTIAVMPDTQFYAQLHPEIFHNQTQWLADNAAKYQIKFMIQVGDVTETSADAEWAVAKAAFKKLEGRVPFASAPGNHDYGGRLQTFTHRSPFSTWLPVASFAAMPTFGGVYDKQPDKCDNQWHQLEAGGRKWLIMGLEFAPRNDVLRWAGEVIAAHPAHSAIIFTHAYLDPKSNERINTNGAGGKNKDKEKSGQTEPTEKPDLTQGEDLWQRVASKHANVVMVLRVTRGCFKYSPGQPSIPGLCPESVRTE